MMRVAQLIDGLREAGGAEKLQETLVRAMAPQGVEITVVTIGNDEPAAVEAMEARGVRVVRFPARRFLDPARAWRLRRFLAAERFDVLHTHLVRSTVLGGALARTVGTPVVATLHNSQRKPTLSKALVRLEAFALRHWVDRVVAVGWQTADAHRARLPGVEVEVLPNAVPAGVVLGDEERRKLRDELGVAADACLCVGVGRLARVKNFTLMIEAFAEVVKYAPQARLRIVGIGTEQAALERCIDSLGLEDVVALTGLRRDVDRVLAASDVYVSSSKYEGLPLAMLEAMHAGLPVVGTDVGDVARVMTEETGRVVEPGDRAGLVREMVGLVEDETLRQALGRAGRERARALFGMEAWARAHVELYTAMARNGRAGRTGEAGQ